MEGTTRALPGRGLDSLCVVMEDLLWLIYDANEKGRTIQQII
jgi:hypothetical protein